MYRHLKNTNENKYTKPTGK